MLQKQAIPINFAAGLDLKTDPLQISVGSFLSLVNATFKVGKRLTKRNGYQSLPALPSISEFATTFNGDLTAVGSSIEAYASGNKSWVNKGSITPITPAVLPLIRNNLNQTQSDSALSSNGFICTVYTESNGISNSFKYVIADSITGQNIIAPTAISGADTVFGTPKVFSLVSYFVIAYTDSSSHLVFIAIPISNPSLVIGPTTITTNYTPALSVNFDGAVLENTLYFAWNTSSTTIAMASVTSTLIVSSNFIVDGSNGATIMSVCADSVNNIIWASYYNSATSTGYSIAVRTSFIVLPFLSEIISSGTILNITSSAQFGTATIFYEVSNSSGGVQTNYISSVTVAQSSGDVGTPVVVLRSVGLASKSFILDGTIYVLGIHSSPYQPTYFLINGSESTQALPVVIAKLAYENGGSYFTNGLPSVFVNGSFASVTYLYKDLVEALSISNAAGTATTGGIYSQTGINLCTFNFGSQDLFTSEIGSNLNIAGCGYLVAYDGYLPVEQNFHLWPEPLSVTTDASAVTPTGTTTSGSNVITAVSSMTGIGIGASVTGTGIPSGQVVIGTTSNTIIFGPLTATGSHSAETITVTGNVSVAQAYYYVGVYSWTDNQGNISRSAGSIPITVTTTGTTSTNTILFPTLRITSKVANPVKLELYRWSTAQQVYYQVTSVTVPFLNDTTIDYITVIDCLADSSIVGNAILYTTGGVVEDTGAPSSVAMTLFDDRLWIVDAEDTNLLWFSKQIIESTPVEMSDLFTVYVAPSIGASGSTGPIAALSAMDDKLIIFKGSPGGLYYINGSGPDNTGSNNQYSQPTFITSMIGCSNQRSIVFQPGGLMFEFASEAGNQIWLLGRDLSTTYIGAPVESATLNSTVLSAVSVPGTNEVRFNMSSGITLKYDYFYGQWGTHTTNAVSSTIYQDLHTYITPQGGVFQETPGLYLDGSSPVLMSFVTGWIQLAGISGYERIWEVQLLGQYVSPHLLNVQMGYDYAPLSEQVLIQPTNFSGAYGGDQLYGQTSPYGGPGSLEQWRIQPATQKCQAFQLSLSEFYDLSLGIGAGAGLTVSAMTCVVGVQRGYRPVKAANTAGTS